MNEIKILTALELRSLYSFNKFLHNKDKKAKNRYKLFSVVWLMIILIICTYIAALTVALCSLGLADIVPTYLVLISSALIFVFGLFKAGYSIFRKRGYDILSSMPIKASSVTLSRFIAMYIEDLAMTLLLMLPGIVAFGIMERPSISFYLIFIFGFIFIPMIPLVLCTLLGTAIMAISSRMKHKSIIQTLILVAFVIAILIITIFLPADSGNISNEQITDFALLVNGIIEKIYLPAAWFGNSMLEFNILNFSLFVLISSVAAMLTIILISENYHRIMQNLSISSAKHNYKIGVLQSKSVLKTLYKREIKRYFSSSIYVTNTIIGPIMGVIASIALCIAGVDKILNVFPIEIDPAAIVPPVFASIFCMMNTTSVSISMEGKNFEIIKSLPISAKKLFDSKILMNLTLMLPCYLVSEVFLIIALKPNFLNLLWIIAFPAVIMLFSVVFGIFVNLKFCNLEWEKEETVVKQSAAAMIGGFAGALIPLAFAIVMIFLPKFLLPFAKLIIALTVLMFTAFIYNYNNKAKLNML